MTRLHRIDALLAAIERGAIVFLFSALILLVGSNIVTRNLVSVSFRHVFEIAPGLVLWLCLLGSTIALRQGRHIKLEVVLRFLPGSIRRLADIASACFGIAVTGVFFAAAVPFVQTEIAMFGARGWFSVIFPVFFFLSAFRFALRLADLVMRREPAPTSDSAGES